MEKKTNCTYLSKCTAASSSTAACSLRCTRNPLIALQLSARSSRYRAKLLAEIMCTLLGIYKETGKEFESPALAV